MQCKITDLRCKEVINVCNGFRLGYVCDIEVNVVTGQVVALVVPGPCRFFGILGREDDYIIPWDAITKIGDDIILINVQNTPGCNNKKVGNKKRGLF